ncbi:glycosyl transferase family 64 domain-containing protein [Chytriomyces sp. MP71]|nr:glycosyl transferase family 64 domain-containing protein [Chytriomyces sp. MP71]
MNPKGLFWSQFVAPLAKQTSSRICLEFRMKRRYTLSILASLIALAIVGLAICRIVQYRADAARLMHDTDINATQRQTGRKTKCTLILNVYDRVHTLREQLGHYHKFEILERIVVVWNHQTLNPPFKVSQYLLEPGDSDGSIGDEKDASIRFKIPVVILKQKQDSLNSRYMPFPEVETDCVISMDDDYQVPEESLKIHLTLFEGSHNDQLIGFKFVARSHKKIAPRKWDYIVEPKNGFSIVLPSGAVFHRKYLQMYADLPRRAHEIVDEKVNGEDILFNLMVANATGKPPVFVDAMMTLKPHKGGLWQRKGHLQARNWCLTALVNEVFDGKMPLVKTDEVLKLIVQN